MKTAELIRLLANERCSVAEIQAATGASRLAIRWALSPAYGVATAFNDWLRSR